ncbi:thermonuclease family protein [Leptolyngbya sp. AN02str]|uniref:thermonuclease family protein n=1 Tax=Leptolyngbya sp. AN02str TaxID=3423363 RepID=UPI003D31B168
MTRVVDGDTVHVQQARNLEKVRLCGIDTPERGEYLSDEATRFLASLVNGQDVFLQPVTRDRYGRLVAEVFLAETEQSLEEELLKAGLAKVFWRYVDDCPNAEPFKLAEEMAKEAKVGLWR